MKSDLDMAVAKFVGAMELVFEDDWAYSSCMIIEFQERISGSGSFLRPGPDAVRSNWGAREALLESYRQLLAVMKQSGLESRVPTQDGWFNFGWDDEIP